MSGKHTNTTFFAAAWSEWWAKFPAPAVLAPGTLRRANVAAMFGENILPSRRAARSVIRAIQLGLRETLGESATWWSPGIGLIDIAYGNLLPSAVDLKHSVVQSMIERCVKEALHEFKVVVDELPEKVVRRLSIEDFRIQCLRTQARNDQIHILDVSEALFGEPDPKQHLTRRVWKSVYRTIDQHLASGGYYVRCPNNQILLLFPAYSKLLGELKRKAIAEDISRSVIRLAVHPDEEEENAAEDGDPGFDIEAGAENADITKIRLRLERERVELNLAFKAMGEVEKAERLGPSALEMPEGFSARGVPLWFAKNRIVGSEVLEPMRKDEAWSRYFSIYRHESDPLNLPMLSVAIKSIQRKLSAERPSVVTVPVNWSFLDRTRLRTHYLEICSHLPEAARRLLVLQLIGVPEDLFTARIDERIRQLIPFCRSVVCQVRLGRDDLLQLKGLPLHSVGIDVGEGLPVDSDLMADMEKFMNAAAPLGRRTFIHGVTKKSLVVAAIGAGFDYIAGLAIPEPGADRPGVSQFSVADLYVRTADA